MKTILIRAIIVSIIWVALFYNNNILFNYLLLHIIITAILFVRSPTAWLKPNFTILWIVSTLLLFGYIFELYVVHICYILFISFAILSSRRTTSQIHWIPAMSPLQYWYGIKGWWRTKSYIEICFKKKLGYQLPLKKLLVILPVAFPCVNIFCELLYISYPNIIWPYVFYGQFHLWHIFIFNEVSHLVFSGWSISNNPNIISISIGSKSYWTRQRDFQVNNDSFSIRLVFSLAKCFIAITLMYLLGAHFKEITYILKTIDTKEVSHISYSLRNTFSIQIFGFLGTSIIVFIDRFINRAGQGHYSLTTKAINIILLVLNLL